MIARTHRFHGRGSLQFVYRTGKTARGSFLSLRFARNSRRSQYRAAVVVSKKVDKSAVVRNRIRRRIYEQLRQQVAADQSYDLVLTAYNVRLAELPTVELQKVVADLLRSAHIQPKVPQQDSGTERVTRGIVDGKES